MRTPLQSTSTTRLSIHPTTNTDSITAASSGSALPTSTKQSKSVAGIIAGAVVGVVAILSLVLVTFWYMCRQRRHMFLAPDYRNGKANRPSTMPALAPTSFRSKSSFLSSPYRRALTRVLRYGSVTPPDHNPRKDNQHSTDTVSAFASQTISTATVLAQRDGAERGAGPESAASALAQTAVGCVARRLTRRGDD